MLARGSLGNPWRFARLLGRRGQSRAAEVADELDRVIDRAEDHLGADRAGRYLRKFYPWYADTLGLTKRERAGRSSPRPRRLTRAPRSRRLTEARSANRRLPVCSGPRPRP